MRENTRILRFMRTFLSYCVTRRKPNSLSRLDAGTSARSTELTATGPSDL